MPPYGNDDPLGKQVSMILLRELPGFAVIGIYFVAYHRCSHDLPADLLPADGLPAIHGLHQLLLWRAALPLKWFFAGH
ncbi:MAG: hypothetical protein CM1200mP2_51920 [Planctomycetaceae bacterium]|nr:MAG: hypothetical protein CM1200mP2_51920 [Planctomycetaceae bacterium]